MFEEEIIALKNRYGPNGIAVYLLIQSWKEVPWRSREGEPSTRDSEVTRLSSWEELPQESSSTWNAALKIAGIRTTNPVLENVWEDAGKVGFDVGSHGAKLLAGATCGELAQLSPEKEMHFFIDMMPWLRKGYWTCSWDDARNRLIVL